MRNSLYLLFAIALAGCGNDPGEPSPTDKAIDTADRAIDSLSQKYDELTERELGDPVQWAQEDIENIGDWDYKIVELDNVTAEELEAALNELGNERWQAFWVEKRLTGYTIMLKRTSISYLSKIPLSQIGRIMLGGSESGQ